MVRKRYPGRDAKPPKIDDLKIINGIGPAVEKRLNGVGILTFVQLAALSPADIAAAVADLTGLSSERIIKQDWIGQACKLAAEAMASETQEDVEPQAFIEPTQAATLSEEPDEDVVPLMERYHPASFTIEFLLDEHNDVHSTHIIHVQSGREDTWTGWQKAQLVDFLSESAGLNMPSDEGALFKAGEPVSSPAVVEEFIHTEEPVHPPALVTASEPVSPLVVKPSLTGTLRGREMEVIEVTTGSPRRSLTHDEPFDVRLTLDLSELQVSGDTPLNYKASIYGKNLSKYSGLDLGESRGSRSGIVVGEVQGTIIPADTVTIQVEKNSLPEGIYHLAGTIIIGLTGMKLAVRPGTTVIIDGGQVQVF